MSVFQDTSSWLFSASITNLSHITRLYNNSVTSEWIKRPALFISYKSRQKRGAVQETDGQAIAGRPPLRPLGPVHSVTLPPH